MIRDSSTVTAPHFVQAPAAPHALPRHQHLGTEWMCTGVTVDLRPQLLLIVNDSGARDAIRMLLRVEGYRVMAVSSLEAAQSTAHDRIDLVVTDEHLPGGKSATEAIDTLRRTLGVGLKAVIVTWFASGPASDPSTDSDVCTLCEPVFPERLMALIREMNCGHP